MPLHLGSISASQLKSLRPHQTVFFFPVGPIEDHGPHLPMGLDLMVAERICFETAKRLETEKPGWTAIIMPTAPLGVDTDTTETAITVRGYVLRDWLVDSCTALRRHGFRNYVCISGNAGPRQLATIEDAGRSLAKVAYATFPLSLLRHLAKPAVLISASSKWVDKKTTSASPAWPDPIEHGGREDSSLALVIAPDLVAPTQAHLPPVERDASRWTRTWKRFHRKLSGYWGDPSAASAKHGTEVIDEKIQAIFPGLCAVLDGANPKHHFKSGYSMIPSNRSTFKAWLLSAVLAMLLLILMILSLKTQMGE